MAAGGHVGRVDGVPAVAYVAIGLPAGICDGVTESYTWYGRAGAGAGAAGAAALAGAEAASLPWIACAGAGCWDWAAGLRVVLAGVASVPAPGRVAARAAPAVRPVAVSAGAVAEGAAAWFAGVEVRAAALAAPPPASTAAAAATAAAVLPRPARALVRALVRGVVRGMGASLRGGRGVRAAAGGRRPVSP